MSFEDDVVLSQMNEYEVLQLLMGDCRERIAAYSTNAEDEVKLLQRPETTPRCAGAFSGMLDVGAGLPAANSSTWVGRQAGGRVVGGASRRAGWRASG